MTPLQQLTQWFEQRSQRHCHRQLLVISGSEKWTEQTAISLLNQNTTDKHLWVGNTPSQLEHIEVKDYRLKLGQEYQYVILNCFKGYRANAAIALSGTITRHGLMIMLCPEFSEWPTYPDPEQINRISYGFHNLFSTSHFYQYLIACLRADKSIAIATETNFVGQHTLVDNLPIQQSFENQTKVVEQICKVLTGHRNRPLIVTADRGRGKSSALGLASAALMQRRSLKIWVTAQHVKAVEQVFKHCANQLPEHSADTPRLNYQGSSLTFKPVDKLLESDDTADLVMVDEAAALPIHLLLKLARKFPRIVFCSTVHGYEGSGRGFEIKFKKQLGQIKPEYRIAHLSQPIRWFEDDNLEKFWFNTLLHRSAIQDTVIQQSGKPIEVSYQCITPEELIAKPELLASIFCLLQNAHYQTSPDDLQRLLDSPESRLFVCYQNHTLVGVAHILDEGGDALLDVALGIASCVKRVRGHLVSQNLTSTYNKIELSHLKQWRVSRIAIDSSLQGRGLGTKLLEFVETQAHQHQIAMLTTSFGCTETLLKFWAGAGLLPVKLSLKPEVSSGEHSCICIKPLNTSAEKAYKAVQEEFSYDLLYCIDKDLKHLSAETLFPLLSLSCFKPPSFIQEIIEQFIQGSRPLLSCKRHLSAAMLHRIAELQLLSSREKALASALLFQAWSDQKISSTLALKGKKEIEEQTREIFAKIFNK